MKQIIAIAKKELHAYFASPIAFIFISLFVFVCLFAFFWVDAFFARNLADIRPLFEWIPLLMIFLVSALTMRLWSEERRMGTLEFLMTTPIKTTHLVLGKFSAGLILVIISLALTLPLSVSVSLMGNLDWGPVVGGYFAATLMAGAYVAIGLYLSARNENQIISLILTVFVCGVFYLLGSQALSGFFGHRVVEILGLLGTSSRFESIARGILDLRDIYYYVSLMGVFLSLNVFALTSLRWSKREKKPAHRQERWVLILFVLNFLGANGWLHVVEGARWDLTSDQRYTLSPATKNFIEQLQEPLVIRGYFSEKTHPKLAPLVPQIRDMIAEYALMGHGKILGEVVDPTTDEDLEAEAQQKYDIKPVPFQFDDRYQVGLVNSYFHILVEYGDQFEVLDFRDLIEVKQSGVSDLEVQLRNLEYDLTRSIKKSLYGFKGMEHLFAQLKKPAHFVAYVSEENLPEQLKAFQQEIMPVLEKIKSAGQGQFSFEIIDPKKDPEVEMKLAQEYGFAPMAEGAFDAKTFYFYMVLEGGPQVVALQLPQDLSADSFRHNLEAGLKRMAPGFIKTIGFVTPPAPEMQLAAQQAFDQQTTFMLLQNSLAQSYHVIPVELDEGMVDESIDVLMVLAPQSLSEKSIFSIDQFLMKGGNLILVTSPFKVNQSQHGMVAEMADSGLTDWLANIGIYQTEKLVLDKQNAAFPVVVNKTLGGGFQVQEVQMIPYPFAVDVRDEGMSSAGITAGIPQVTMYWASPIVVDSQKNSDRKFSDILKSSPESWATDSTLIEPNFREYEALGFAEPNESFSYVLASVVEGSFESFFKGKADPRTDNETISSIVTKSPNSARILLFSSNDMLSDQVLEISRTGGNAQFMNNLQLMENAVDWAVEDRALLGIRSRGQFARLLRPMEKQERMFWEYSNYVFAILGLALIYWVNCWLRNRSQKKSRSLGF